MSRRPIRKSASAILGSAAVIAAALSAGCLWEPPPEESWTRLEIVSATPKEPGSPEDSVGTLAVHARVTYRDIVTASVVAEVRSSSLTPAEVEPILAMEPTIPSAASVDRIIASSTVLARETVLVTGFDHLIQEFDFDVPWAAAGDTTGAPAGLFLVLYMGDVDEVETEAGEDSLVVTPYLSTDKEILFAAMPIPDGLSR